MQTSEIILELRSRVADFRKSKLYEGSKALQFDINAIEIAISLASLGVNNNRPLLESEEYWFEGEYLISNDFTGEWKDIAVLYSKLVSIVKSNNLFRNNLTS